MHENQTITVVLQSEDSNLCARMAHFLRSNRQPRVVHRCESGSRTHNLPGNNRTLRQLSYLALAGRPGLEPGTGDSESPVLPSTPSANGTREGHRTLNRPGKSRVLCRLSYTRSVQAKGIEPSSKPGKSRRQAIVCYACVVGMVGIEPTISRSQTARVSTSLHPVGGGGGNRTRVLRVIRHSSTGIAIYGWLRRAVVRSCTCGG